MLPHAGITHLFRDLRARLGEALAQRKIAARSFAMVAEASRKP